MEGSAYAGVDEMTLLPGLNLFHFLEIYIVSLLDLGTGWMLCIGLLLEHLLLLLLHAVLKISHLSLHLPGRTKNRYHKIKNEPYQQVERNSPK